MCRECNRHYPENYPQIMIADESHVPDEAPEILRTRKCEGVNHHADPPFTAHVWATLVAPSRFSSCLATSRVAAMFVAVLGTECAE
jgi:hypothetical protein